MRILIDTNILIPLEDSSTELPDNLASFFRVSQNCGHDILIHPRAFEDLERDRDERRRRITASRANKYPQLESPPAFHDGEIEQFSLAAGRANDDVDNDLLAAVYHNAVKFLVTEDHGIHAKAVRIGIQDRVLFVDQACELLNSENNAGQVDLPNIVDVCLHEIRAGDDPFFDSLREDYTLFDKWFARASQAGRRAWLNQFGDNRIGGIAVYKPEDDPIVTSDNRALRGQVLKLCTFKVAETARGNKVGELLLKAAFRYASQNGCTSIYCTVRQGKHDALRTLLAEFGFEVFGQSRTDDGVDDVFVKLHPTTAPARGSLDAVEYNRKYYPHIALDDVEKCIIPIRPEFHRTLFPDFAPSAARQLSLFTAPAHAAGNAIRQAYLCHSRVKPRPGSVALFYQSVSLKAVTSVGVIESVSICDSADEIALLVSNRTVYSPQQIASMAQKPVMVILFRLIGHFAKQIPLSWLLSNGVVNGNIQTIRILTEEQFATLRSQWGLPWRNAGDTP